MFIHNRNPLDPVGGRETPREAFLSRRKLLAALAAGGLGVAGYAGWRTYRGTDEEVLAGGRREDGLAEKVKPYYPAAEDGRFTYGRPETIEVEAARYTNFYEFSSFKSSWRLVERFKPDPWTIRVDGLCRQPLQLNMDEFLGRFAADLTERQYRHRCVERWAMAIPWTGVPLAAILRAADPLEKATHVRFVSFNRPDEASGMRDEEFPWPYQEGLTLAEAGNVLAFLATGMYGHPLYKQHGAPIRLVVPWKYGFKSIKSIERIEFVDRQPATFWNTMNPQAYGFESNVDPAIPRPWPQTTETMLGSGATHRTQIYNGYGDYVSGLYS